MSTLARQLGPLLEASQALGDSVRDQNATWLAGPRNPAPGRPCPWRPTFWERSSTWWTAAKTSIRSPRPGPGGQALGASRRGVHGDGGDAPSTITRFALDALSRMASSGAYSGESYQRRALSTLGNSSSTMRLGCQAPSRTSNYPPRTAKRPPYFSTVAGTSLRYSASPGSSCTSISTIT